MEASWWGWGGGFFLFTALFEVNFFWLTVLLSFSMLFHSLFPFRTFIVSFPIKVLLKRLTDPLIVILLNSGYSGHGSPYLGGVERESSFSTIWTVWKLRTPSSFLPFRSPEGLDSQPPALPPKQLSRKTLSQIIQAHSQQSLLDNHVNEMYDVPVNADKTTVSHFERWTQRLNSEKCLIQTDIWQCLTKEEHAANLPILHFTLLLQLNGVVPHDNLVLIKMRPDEHGRFGFNVKVRTYTYITFQLLIYSFGCSFHF